MVFPETTSASKSGAKCKERRRFEPKRNDERRGVTGGNAKINSTSVYSQFSNSGESTRRENEVVVNILWMEFVSLSLLLDHACSVYVLQLVCINLSQRELVSFCFSLVKRAGERGMRKVQEQKSFFPHYVICTLCPPVGLNELQ